MLEDYYFFFFSDKLFTIQRNETFLETVSLGIHDNILLCMKQFHFQFPTPEHSLFKQTTFN